MKRVFSKAIYTVLLILLFLPTAVLPTYAISTADAKEAVDTSRACSLQLTYSAGGGAASGKTVKLYKVAELSKDFKYTLCGVFAKYPISMSGVVAQSEWNGIASALNAYIVADNIKPTKTATTNSAGVASFSGLSCGMYLASSVSMQLTDTAYTFGSFLISVPNLNEDGTWNYQVSAFPKSVSGSPSFSEADYKVIKAWNDEGNRDKRTKSVSIEIYKNGTLYKKETLNSANNWSFSWSAVDDGSVWTVAERNVPKGYTVSIYNTDNTFSVVNTYRGDDPVTGDGIDIMLYIILMCASGAAMLAIGIIGRKRKTEG